MDVSVTDEQWKAVRESVRVTVERFCELVASVPDPAATASVGWTVADVAAHLTTVAFLETGLLRAAAEPPFQMPGLAEAVAATTVETVHDLNDKVMSHFRERDVTRVLGMLRHHVGLMLTASQDRDPGETVSWLGEARITLAAMHAHMVNELLLHGNDIARSVKVPWAMPAEDAALFFDLFTVGVANGDKGRLLDGSKRPLQRRIAVEMRSGYTTPVTLVVCDGKLSAEPVGPGADAWVRFDPATLNMMMFGRISRAQAVLTRKVVIGGRRPWLVPAFLRTARFPS